MVLISLMASKPRGQYVCNTTVLAFRKLSTGLFSYAWFVPHLTPLFYVKTSKCRDIRIVPLFHPFVEEEYFYHFFCGKMGHEI
jgi:hypothetical protein